MPSIRILLLWVKAKMVAAAIVIMNPDGLIYDVSGKDILKVAPDPGVFLTPMVPLCSSMILLQTERPIPIPSFPFLV